MTSLKKISLQVIFAMFTLSTTFAQSPTKETKIKFTEYDLKNGLHVILHEDHSAPVVCVSVLYHVGSKNEDTNRTGFAHFFEHLLFEGSKYIDRGEFDMYIQKAGGYNNANTSSDRTFYYEVLTSNNLALGLWLESERMLHAKITNEGLETQREVVKEEKRQRIDNRPYGTILIEVLKRAYTVHPYQWAPIGSMAHLNAASLEDFKAFYKTYYVPNNATLSIAGDIDIEKAKKLVEKYFAGIPQGTQTIPRVTVVEPPQTKEIRDTVYRKISLPAVIQTYHIPAQGTEDYYAINMLTKVLSDGESSRFSKNIVNEKQLALTTQAIPFAMEDPGLFITFGLVNAGVSPEKLENAMNAEIEKVRTELITEKEYQKVLNQIKTDFVNSYTRVSGVAEALANYHVYFGDANLINTEFQRYKDVTREEILQVAKKYLVPTNRIVLYYLPKSSQ